MGSIGNYLALPGGSLLLQEHTHVSVSSKDSFLIGLIDCYDFLCVSISAFFLLLLSKNTGAA